MKKWLQYSQVLQNLVQVNSWSSHIIWVKPYVIFSVEFHLFGLVWNSLKSFIFYLHWGKVAAPSHILMKLLQFRHSFTCMTNGIRLYQWEEMTTFLVLICLLECSCSGKLYPWACPFQNLPTFNYLQIDQIWSEK